MGKTYYLVHLDFWHSTWKVIQYRKSRRFTAKQAWKYIFTCQVDDDSSGGAGWISGELRKNANMVDDYSRIIESYHLPAEYTDLYCTFSPIH